MWRQTLGSLLHNLYSILMATNLESSYHMSQLAYPLLKDSGSGSIVFISSVAGLVHSSVGSVYSDIKGMIMVLDNKEFLDIVASRTPLKHLGEANDVSSFVAFPCLPVASYITGQTIAVNGRFTVNGFS
uniref:Uncharacterized protein n=1 Tax=Lactuca sativa TaxID=4236 RepID=A0A9R1WIX6_LACSA|nr:hypothetical protein LSAT_V11C200080970 [Lactuca sativa]